MSDQPSTLGAYPVERELGRGGMGVVYLGRDPRLHRLVAIKILSGVFAQHPEHLARFEREAKLLASLNHPNIAAIHGVDSTPDGQQLLVLEYVPGDTLAERLTRGRLSLDDALDVGRQIALAVEAAHEGGVIHRDLKPGNVKITPEGQVKVLDFGLAKGGTAASDLDLAQSPTFTSAPTATGVILGTAGYMSPEQARGRPVDKRSDIWSFACVLFECLTGRRLFDGETISDTIARILEREPDWAALPPETPPRVRELLRRCLEKDVRKRQRDIGDVRIELEEALAARSSSSRIVPADPDRGAAGRWRWQRTAGAAVLLALGAVAGIAFWVGLSTRDAGGAAASLVRLSVAIPADLRVRHAQITPDGSRLILQGMASVEAAGGDRITRLYSRPFDTYEATPIAGTDRVQRFAISADSRWLAVLAVVNAGSIEKRLTKVSIDGSSAPIVIAHWDPAWLDAFAWLEDGDLLATKTENRQQVLFRIPANGGSPGPPITLGVGADAVLRLFGRSVRGHGLFAQVDRFGARGYQTNVWLIDPNTGAGALVVEDAATPVYLDSGHLLFARDDTLLAAPFDLDRKAIAGELVALVNGLSTPAGPGEFELADNGTLAYVPSGAAAFDRQLIVVDANGGVAPWVAERGRLTMTPAISRDGRRAALTVLNQTATYEIWIADATRGTLRRRFAIPNADVLGPIWSADDQSLVYQREGLDAGDGVYIQPLDGSRPARQLGGTPGEFLKPTGWLPDRSGLIVTKSAAARRDLMVLPMSADGTAAPVRPLRATPHNESDAVLSPDGRLLAYWSDETGRREIYVAPFDNGTLGAPVPVSNGACGLSRWAPTSRRLYFCALPGTLMFVDVTTTPALTASAPVPLHDLHRLRINLDGWSVLSDGRIVGIQRSEAEESVPSINVVLNWGAEVRQRLRARR